MVLGKLAHYKIRKTKLNSSLVVLEDLEGKPVKLTAKHVTWDGKGLFKQTSNHNP